MKLFEAHYEGRGEDFVRVFVAGGGSVCNVPLYGAVLSVRVTFVLIIC